MGQSIKKLRKDLKKLQKAGFKKVDISTHGGYVSVMPIKKNDLFGELNLDSYGKYTENMKSVNDLLKAMHLPITWEYVKPAKIVTNHSSNNIYRHEGEPVIKKLNLEGVYECPSCGSDDISYYWRRNMSNGYYDCNNCDHIFYESDIKNNR